MRTPNKAHPVDAPIARVFHFVHPWRRAIDAPRWAIKGSVLSIVNTALDGSTPFPLTCWSWRENSEFNIRVPSITERGQNSLFLVLGPSSSLE